MRFYIISLILHLVLLTSVFHYSGKHMTVDSKNVVVYLNELKATPNPEPLSAPPAQVVPEEKPKEKPKEKKKEIVKKKVEKKKTPKRVKATKEVKPVEKEVEEVEEVAAPVVNPFAGMGIEGGTYVGDQRNMGGFGYTILREVDPKYPQMAKRIGFKDEVVVRTKFLVGTKGKVEKVIFLDNFEKYGFHAEVEKALYKWEFAPIIYHGKAIKMYFYKDFRFNVRTR